MQFSSSDIVIRKAKLSDVPEIAYVHLNSWQETYAGLLPQEFIDSLPLTFKKRMLKWKKVIATAQKTKEDGVFVAVAQPGIIGFSSFTKSDTLLENNLSFQERFCDSALLSGNQVLKKFQGQGIGYQLFLARMQKIAYLGYKKAHCWVLENNPTIRFHERTGGVFTGIIQEETIGEKKVNLLAYEWDNVEQFKHAKKQRSK